MNISALSTVAASTTGTSRTASSASSVASASSSSSSAQSQTVAYSSPVVTYDAQTFAIILEWRDPTTGQELYQSPSRTALLYERSQSETPQSKRAVTT